MYDLVRILQIFHVQSVRARRGLSTCVRTSYEIVTPWKCVTISTPQGGADVMRAPVYSTSVLSSYSEISLDKIWTPGYVEVSK